MHMYSKYEVSMSNSVPGEVCTDDNTNIDANDDAQQTIHYCIRLFD